MKRADEVSGLCKIFVVVCDSWYKDMTNPDWLFDFVKISEHFAYIFACAAGEFFMLFLIDVLDVYKKNVRNFHETLEFFEPFALALERTASCVNAGVDSAFLCFCKKFKQKINLCKRFTT